MGRQHHEFLPAKRTSLEWVPWVTSAGCSWSPRHQITKSWEFLSTSYSVPERGKGGGQIGEKGKVIETLGTELVLKPRPLAYPAWLRQPVLTLPPICSPLL